MANIGKLTINFDQNRSLRDLKKNFRADMAFFISWSPALGRVRATTHFNLQIIKSTNQIRKTHTRNFLDYHLRKLRKQLN